MIHILSRPWLNVLGVCTNQHHENTIKLKSDFQLLSFINQINYSNPSISTNFYPKWSNHPPAAAAHPSVSVPRKPPAHAANNPPWNVHARRKLLRTASKVHDAHVVSFFSLLFPLDQSTKCVTNPQTIGARPAGECTCDRASQENVTPSGNTCACGQRSAGSCTCEKAADGGLLPGEVDFTSKA